MGLYYTVCHSYQGQLRIAVAGFDKPIPRLKSLPKREYDRGDVTQTLMSYVNNYDGSQDYLCLTAPRGAGKTTALRFLFC